jgi:hypothetical protein
MLLVTLAGEGHGLIVPAIIWLLLVHGGQPWKKHEQKLGGYVGSAQFRNLIPDWSREATLPLRRWCASELTASGPRWSVPQRSSTGISGHERLPMVQRNGRS